MEELVKYKKLLLQPELGNNTCFKSEQHNSIRFDFHNDYFNRVVQSYISASSYLATIPSYHIGYEFATEKMFSILPDEFSTREINILELCCGFGGTLTYVSSRFKCNYLGVDFNYYAINNCANKIENLNSNSFFNVRCQNILDFNDTNEKYDLIIIEDALTHIPEKKFLFNLLYRLLKNHGALLFSDLITTKKSQLIDLNKLKSSWVLHELLNLSKYDQLLKDTGFEIIDSMCDIGECLVYEHNRIDIELGDRQYFEYIQLLEEQKKVFIEKWGLIKYYFRLERLKVFDYINEGKLDYLFIAARKKTIQKIQSQ